MPRQRVERLAGANQRSPADVVRARMFVPADVLLLPPLKAETSPGTCPSQPEHGRSAGSFPRLMR